MATSIKQALAEPHLCAMDLLKNLIPLQLRVWLRQQQRRYAVSPPVGWVRLGSLRRLEPICADFGFSRGSPVDRYYIEQFLAEHASDIQGNVLEVGDDYYTKKFGGDRVTSSDILFAEGNPNATMVRNLPGATIVADLVSADHVASNKFDCIICTQTLLCIYDLQAAVRTLHRILKPGGILLTTNPGIGRLDAFTMERWGQFWRFTSLSIRRLLEGSFQPENVTVRTYGNVLAATASLQGIAAEELRKKDLDYRDPGYQVSIAARAVKTGLLFFVSVIASERGIWNVIWL